MLKKVIRFTLIICLTVLFGTCLKTKPVEAKMYENETTVKYEVTFNQIENIQVPNMYKKVSAVNVSENKKNLPVTGEFKNDRYTIYGYGFIFLAIYLIYLNLIKYRKRGKDKNV